MPRLQQFLRAHTASRHARLGALPFFQSLRAGTLPKPAIVSFLRSLAVIHAVLERSLSQVSGGPVAALRACVRPKLPLLMADLDALDAARVPSITAAIRRALEYGADIIAAAGNPLNLAGVLYVLEGSQNGGAVLLQDYARCLAIPASRLSSIGCYGRETADHWSAFCAILDALELDPVLVEQVAGAATDCFERLGQICAALYPYLDKDLRHHVAAVNVEAGDHAMPQDPREIDLALRAGRAAWERYPYLGQRFGERGKRFTSSDSCWLVALTRMPLVTATKSLDWLRSVLASRGIPTVILEAHLAAITGALAVECPDHVALCARYGHFLRARDAERRALPGAAGLPELIEQFERRLRASSGLTIAPAAQLIASAWVDEHCGIAGALEAVRNWFVDADRFSGDWIANVDELVARLDDPGRPPC